jgi:hypothetical protein
MEFHGRSERHFTAQEGMRNSIILLQSSQALPACPSDKGSTTVKKLKRFKVVALVAKRLNFYAFKSEGMR